MKLVCEKFDLNQLTKWKHKIKLTKLVITKIIQTKMQYCSTMWWYIKMYQNKSGHHKRQVKFHFIVFLQDNKTEY